MVFNQQWADWFLKVAQGISAAGSGGGGGGILAAVDGGTGFGAYAIGDILYANTGTTLNRLADVATGNALISGGVGVAPSWGKIGLTTHVSGVLPPANGGTGVANSSNITIGGAVTFSGAFSLTATLTGNTTVTFPVSGTLESTSNKDSANGYAGLNASSRITKGADSTDDFILDLATKGLVLKDTQGSPHYWRVTVDTSGALVTTDLGTSKP
jgi:hypothetical protein